MQKKVTLLIILDGFGLTAPGAFNAITSAHTPTLDYFFKHYPWTSLQASGRAVGLPAGYIGNSEVGHLTIGAGRVIEQPLTVINKAIDQHTLETTTPLRTMLTHLAAHKKPLHIMGLLSDAGVHSDVHHLYAYMDIAQACGIEKIYLHAFLDGRDVAPFSAATYLTQLDNYSAQNQICSLASVHGRYYAMDRNQNWQRTLESYQVLTQPQQTTYDSWQTYIAKCYAQNISDEFIPPVHIGQSVFIQPDDGILCFNFRPDRIRQLTSCFVAPSEIPNTIPHIPLTCFITPYPYGNHIPTSALFNYPIINNTLKEVLNTHQEKLFCIAETEKYAHVTYFFNGEKEELLEHETRIIIPSHKAQTYAHDPCMSAPEITDAVITALTQNNYDFYLINYANADMVGHSGDIQATIKAIECLDAQLERLHAMQLGMPAMTIYLTADHGKAETLWNTSTQQPHTAHTNNPVPFIVISSQTDKDINSNLQGLADIAPLILQELGLPVPPEMKR